MRTNSHDDSHHPLSHEDAHRIGDGEANGIPTHDSDRASRGVAQDVSRNTPEVVGGAAEANRDHRLGRSVSIDQAAQMLNVSRRTVYNRIGDGRLRTIRTIGGSQRVLVESLYELGFRPRAFSTSASAVSFAVRRATRD